jgi:hypothetical protein
MFNRFPFHSSLNNDNINELDDIIEEFHGRTSNPCWIDSTSRKRVASRCVTYTDDSIEHSCLCLTDVLFIEQCSYCCTMQSKLQRVHDWDWSTYAYVKRLSRMESSTNMNCSCHWHILIDVIGYCRTFNFRQMFDLRSTMSVDLFLWVERIRHCSDCTRTWPLIDNDCYQRIRTSYVLSMAIATMKHEHVRYLSI